MSTQERQTAGLSLILPMAGLEADGSFRGFKTALGETLVHRALRSFAPYRGQIEAVYAIVLAEHEERFQISARLKVELDTPVTLIMLDAPTAGPAETVMRGVRKAGLRGPAIVCDVDHRLAVEPLFCALDENPDDCAVSVWPLAGEELKRWSVACVGGNGRIVKVADKRLPAGAGFFHGVIGCYYFPDIADVVGACRDHAFVRFSDYFNALVDEGRAARAVHLETAEFFGDEERIKTLEGGRPRGTIFCDIDGTLICHQDKPDYTRPAEVLPGSREKLQAWIAEGYCVVLCTARSQKDESKIAAMLADLNIPYHRLVTGLPSGLRVLINDRKPYEIFSAQADSIEISRNAGIGALEIRPSRKPQVLRRFDGGSFAETLLLEDGGKTFVRKRVAKNGNLAVAYQRLRNQFRTLERFAYLDPDLVPALLGEENNSHEYYYDMEFLADHVALADCDDALQVKALDRLLDRFGAVLYCQRSRNGAAAEEWLTRHLEAKIASKLTSLGEYESLRPLLHGDGVTIDGFRVKPLAGLLDQLHDRTVLSHFVPLMMTPVHGDFTFQNIMVRADGDVKVIDMEALEGLEATELDMGKLMQSTHSRYEAWSHIATPLCRRTADGFDLAYTPPSPNTDLQALLRRRWSAILGCSEDAVETKGLFYLSLHHVRMVPFRMKVSLDQATYALATALVYMNRAIAAATSGKAGRVQQAA